MTNENNIDISQFLNINLIRGGILNINIANPNITEINDNLNRILKKDLKKICDEFDIDYNQNSSNIILKELIESHFQSAEGDSAEGDSAEGDSVEIEIKNMDGLLYLATIDNNSIDLVLTDPPYSISKESGMNTHYNDVKNNEFSCIIYISSGSQFNFSAL